MGESEQVAGPTVVQHADGPPPRLESKLALARARERLLGRAVPPSTMGRYAILERLGSGGMGIVYSARDPDLDRVVAVKVLRSRMIADTQGRSRLVREAQALAKLSHPNVVHVYEVGREGDQVFIAMEFVQGRTLTEWVEQETPSVAHIVQRYVDAGRGLLTAHTAGVIHRDFKPDNVLVGDDGRVRVMDFGLARPSVDEDTLTQMRAPEDSHEGEQGTESMTKTGMVMGTPAYMDPQQLMGEGADAASDQYAFCVSLYESLYGERPFSGSTVTDLFNTIRKRRAEALEFPARPVPRSLQSLLRRGLAYGRDERFASFEALLVELEATMGQHPPRRGRWLLPTLGVLALGTVGYLAGVATRPAEPVEAPQPDDARAEIIAASDLPTPVETPLPEDPMGTTVHRLDNGLTVYLVPRPHDPSVRVQVVLRAGPSEETAPGVADWLTGVVAAGSERLGVRDAEAEAPLLEAQHEALAKLEGITEPEQRASLLKTAHEAHVETWEMLGTHDIEYVAKEFGVGYRSSGVDIGTTYESELPSGALEGWLALHAEMLARPAFRGVVLEVAEALENLPWLYASSRNYQGLMGRTAQAYGRGRDTEAEYASLQEIPFSQLRSFHDTYYRPNNAALILVGNVTPDSVLPMVEKAFGDWEPAPLPEPAILRDQSLPDAGEMIEVVAPASEEVWLGLSLPPVNDGTRPEIEALASLLSGPHGLFEGAYAEHELLERPWVMLEGRTLVLAAAPRDGVSPQQVEAAILERLREVAGGEVAGDAWDMAAARWPLDAASWDRSRTHLTGRIAESFLLHREWSDVVRGHRAAGPARAELEAVAARLLERDHVTMHVEPGPPWAPDGPALPIQVDWMPNLGDAEPGAFAEQLAALPRPVVEPQFLSEGMHFQSTAWGDAKVVTREARGVLFWADLEFPVGVRDDAFVCDAVRMRADRWLESAAMTQLDLDVWCEPDSTTIAISGVASSFEGSWRELWRRIDETELSEALVRDAVEATLRARRQARAVPGRLEIGLSTYAWHGERGLQHHMPDDATLAEAPASRFEESLERLAATTPDISHAGPDPALLRANLPSPRAPRAEEPDAPPAQLREHTFYVVDAPALERADARLFVDWITDTPRDALLADIYVAQPGPAFEQTAERDMVAYTSPVEGIHGVIPPAYTWGYEARHEDIAALLVSAIDDHADGPDPKWYAQGRNLVESAYRNERYARIEIPRYVQSWSGTIDPRIARWSELGRVSPETFAAYARRVGERPLAVSLVCDVSRVDLTALEAVGRVVLVSREDALRNTRERHQ